MSKSSRILLLASYAPSLLNFRGPLIRDMIGAGHSVSVGAPDIDATTRGDLEKLGASVHEVPLHRNGTGIRSDLAYLRALWRLIKHLQPDILLTYTIKPNIWGAFAAARAGVASAAMVTGLGYAFAASGGSMKSRAARWIARRLYRAATKRNTRVIFQNPDDRDDFVSQGCLADRSKIGMVNGSGVDLAHYQRAPLPKAPTFLMIARLLVSKGVREYAEAARHLRKRYPDARFVLVGPHDEGLDAIDPSEFQAWIDEGLIEWPGPANDVRPAIREAAVYVLPSYREGTPRSVLEAMAMGRPIITSDAPGCRETIRDGVEGFLVPPKDSKALSDAMERFLLDPDLIPVMGEAAYARAVDKYAVERVNRQMMKLLGLEVQSPPSA